MTQSIGVVYYTTNKNTFNEIVIGNFPKLYNMTYIFLLKLYLKNIITILFLKKPHIVCTTLILMDLNTINKVLLHKNNENYHKYTK
jgi:hypothetical protein